MPKLTFMFEVNCSVDVPVVVGQDEVNGRRQLIPVTGGELKGEGIHGVLLPGAVDSQIIRPDGKCDLSARYAVRLDDGEGIYIENNGIRTVPPEYVEEVKNGGFIDPSLYYFCTTPKIETYSEKYRYLSYFIYVCSATRTKDSVIIRYYRVDQE